MNHIVHSLPLVALLVIACEPNQSSQEQPEIQVSTPTIQGLDYAIGYGPSEEQSVTISGIHLINHIDLVAPEYFEISTEPESNFVEQLQLEMDNGEVGESAIYIILHAGLSTDVYTGSLSISSDEYEDAVSLSGTVVESEVTFPTFEQSLSLESTSETSANIAFGDLNTDGHLDIVLAKGRHWPLFNRVLFGDGTGGIQSSEPLGSVENRTYTALLSDLDVDGDLDIVVSNDSPDANLTYLNDGSGQFSAGSEFGNPSWNTRNSTVADLNNDGYPDIVVANRGGSGTASNYICLNDGNASFDGECVAFSSGSSTTITAGDFNEGGLVDLVVPHRDGGQSYVYVQTDPSTIHFDLIPFGPSNASIRSSQAGDLNNDGLLDIVTIDTDSGVIAYLQQADASFSTEVPIGSSTATPYALSIGDLNLDGTLDIVVGFVRSASMVYYNIGHTERYFEVAFGEQNQGTVYGFALGDFNHDGQLDIGAARSGAPNTVYFGSH